MRRPFLVWVGDVFCGLASYTLTRWIRPGSDPDSVFKNLPVELATFAGIFVLLKLALKGIGIARRKPKPAA
jgi:hypothetical protein